MVIETLGEIRAKYNFWDEKERPYYEALSEAIRVLNAQKDKAHYAKIVRCGECKWNMSCGYISTRSYKEWKDWFCADGERKVQAIKSVTMREGDTDTDGFMRKAGEAVMEVQDG